MSLFAIAVIGLLASVFLMWLYLGDTSGNEGAMIARYLAYWPGKILCCITAPSILIGIFLENEILWWTNAIAIGLVFTPMIVLFVYGCLEEGLDWVRYR